MTDPTDVEKWARRLQQRMSMVGSIERPHVIIAALDASKPLIAAGEVTQAKIVAILYNYAREYRVTSEQLKSLRHAGQSPAVSGFFRSLPTGDDEGPRAA